MKTKIPIYTLGTHGIPIEFVSGLDTKVHLQLEDGTERSMPECQEVKFSIGSGGGGKLHLIHLLCDEDSIANLKSPLKKITLKCATEDKRIAQCSFSGLELDYSNCDVNIEDIVICIHTHFRFSESSPWRKWK